MTSHARALVAVPALALVALGPPASAVPGQVTLTAAPQEPTHGTAVTLAGALDTESACRGGRPVQVQMRRAGGAWAAAGGTATASDGAFSLSDAPDHNSYYRAVLPAETRGATLCDQAVSAEAAVRVHAAVHLGAPAALPAGRCAAIPLTVGPPKPGRTVRLERSTGSAWEPVAEATLDATSSAAPEACAAWEDIGGGLALRALVGGDAENLDGRATADVAVGKPGWMRTIERITQGRDVGVSVRDDGRFIFRLADVKARPPASNEKLLVSMAILERLGPKHRFRTAAMGAPASAGVVPGDVWLVGSGDPTTGRRALRRLARGLVEAGVTGIGGRVLGSTAYFARDWFAPGWKRSFPREEVALPSALTFGGNEAGGRHVKDPERRAAAFFTRRLRALGVTVRGPAGSGAHPSGLGEIAAVESAPLGRILRVVNRRSWNFGAEVLGKRLGAEAAGAPGTIAKGAGGMAAFAAAADVDVTANDASGLSYANRVSPAGLARLLGVAETKPWWKDLHESLAAGGQGTLRGRLTGVRLRAKTGTLTRISALSGWVWMERRGSWAEVSILSKGMPKAVAIRIEDRIVRLMARRGG